MTLPTPPEPVAAIVRAMHEEVVQQLALTSKIGHPGENGRAREEIIRRFLRRFVPRGLRIDTGFVIDVHGGISKQIDIVIYRDNYHPVLEIGGVKHFLVESVVAAIENKASLSSRRALRDALENVRSVKRLDRSAGDQNYVVTDFHGQGTKVSADPRYRVWTAVITEQSVTAQTFMEEIAADMLAHELPLWLDCYVAVHDYATRYIDAENRTTWVPDGAHALVLTDPTGHGGEKPLVDFALLLAGRLRHAAVIDYKPPLYFPTSASHKGDVHLPHADHPNAENPPAHSDDSSM